MSTLTTSTASTHEWVERARSIAPVVEQYRDQSEQQRFMAQPIFEAIRGIGINGMLAPRAFGGPQADLLANLQVIEEIARQDGSAGWNAADLDGHRTVCRLYDRGCRARAHR